MKEDFNKLEKNALGCMYVATGLTALVALLVMTAAGLYFDIFKYSPVLVSFVIVAVLIILSAVISPYFRFHRYRYRLDDDSMEIIEGYIFVSHHIVPIERIQNLQLQQGPIDRMFGVAKMTITTGGGDITVRFVSKDLAEGMSEGLKTMINAKALMDREENHNETEC